MATLTKNAPRSYQIGDEALIPMVADDVIYEGAAVGTSAGYARPLVAGDAFEGFAIAPADNTGGAAGEKSARVRARGRVVLSVSGVSGAGDLGAKVYASDDDTFTTTEGANSLVGVVVEWVSGSLAVVEFDAAIVKLTA